MCAYNSNLTLSCTVYEIWHIIDTIFPVDGGVMVKVNVDLYSASSWTHL